MRSAYFGEIYGGSRLCNLFDRVGRKSEQVLVILVHSGFHNFRCLGKSDCSRKIFGARAKPFLLPSAENDGAEITLLYELKKELE